MKFLYPSFLWALLSVLIPIIIHLFNFRRYKTVYFSNVAFLQSIKKDTKSQSTIKNLLLLLLRILSISFLVLAFARPYLIENDNGFVQKQSVVGIYIDNSFSMEASGKYGVLLENAKMKAHEIANTYNYNTKFLLTTNNFELIHQQLVSKDQFIDWVSQIKVSHIVRTINQVEMLQQQVFGNIDSLSSIHQYILSDFQKQIFNPLEKVVTNIDQQFLVSFNNNNISNIFIDSVWFESPGQFLGKQENLMVSIWNKSDDEVTDLQLNLYVNDSLKSLKNINILADKNIVIEMPFVQTKPGLNYAKVELNDYPITFDNEFYFSYNLTEQINILQIVNGIKVNYLKALYNTDENFFYTELDNDNIDYEVLNKYNVVVLNGLSNISTGLINLLQKHVNNGMRLVIIPSKTGNQEHYQNLLTKLEGVQMSGWREEKGVMQKLNLEHSFFKESIKKTDGKIRLPEYEGYYSIFSGTNSDANIILESEAGKPLIIQEQYGNGDYILFTLPLDSDVSSIATHPVAVPLFYNLALYSNKITDLYYTLSPDLSVSIKENGFNGVVKLLNMQNNSELMPKAVYGNNTLKMFLNDQIVDAGYYKIISDIENGNAFALNYSRAESDMSQYTEKELKLYAENQNVVKVNVIKGDQKSVNAEIVQSNKGNSLSVLFLWLLVIALIAEMLVLKFLN